MSATGSSHRYQLVESLFQRAIDLPREQRGLFLDSACDGDAGLRAELDTLLQHYGEAPAGYLESAIHGLREGPGAAMPERVGRYTVIRLLGRGGMGAVYEAEQPQPRRRVALKLVRHDLRTDESLRRFRHEADVLGQLRHPGIAQIYEFGVGRLWFDGAAVGEQPFFAMELVSGSSLTQFAHERRLDLRARLALLAATCDAVNHAHQKGVIHRDLKPSNVLVTQDGDAAVPKVLDFGVARVTHHDGLTVSAHTATGQLVGTVPYMSPEQLTGDAHAADTRSDVYSLGVMLYELLAGRLPFDLSDKPLAAAARIVAETPPPLLGTVNRALRGDLETIVSRALEKEPARRYPSADALAADVRRYLNNEPIEARRDSSWYVARKLLARHRIPIGAALAFVGLLAVSTVVLSVLYRERGQLLERAQSAEARHRQRFDQVRRLAQSLMFDLHPKLDRVAGATPARIFLINSAIEYLDSLAQDAGDEPALWVEIAQAYQHLGSLQGNPNYVSIGDTAGALTSYQKSREWFERVVAHEPDHLVARRMLGQLHSGVGDVLALCGRTAESDASYRAAHDVASALAAEHPDAPDVQLDVGLAHVKLGVTEARAGHVAEALSHRQQAVTVFEAVAAADPANEKARVQLAVALLQVGDSLMRTDAAAALTTYEQCLQRRRELAAAAPDNVDHRRSLGIAWQRVGNAQAVQPGAAPDAAMNSYEESLALFDELARADPQDVRAQRDLSVAHEKIGVTCVRAGRWSDAVASFRPSLEIRQRLCADAPDNLEFASDLVVSLAKLGQALVRLGDLDAARPHLEAGLERALFLRQREPANAKWARPLAMAQSQLAALHAARAEQPTAGIDERLADWRKARELLVATRESLMQEKPPADVTGIDSEIAACDKAIEVLLGGSENGESAGAP